MKEATPEENFAQAILAAVAKYGHERMRSQVKRALAKKKGEQNVEDGASYHVVITKQNKAK